RVSGDLMIPNPIYDNHILLPNSVDNWQILNSNGQTVLKGNDVYVQLSELSAGLYQLVTRKDGQVISKAILIP
ncbi:MAG: T9SS type A sorting domain-containing protein, partial [Bacteroidota bacterium]|nr:T9SS type A sorting domain-containing protein [Bacteroidota bacterium]